jgi:phospholipid N-methyltransferase
MQSRLRFFKQWARNPREIGSITPSSQFLTREVIEPVRASGARFVVELGPGTGVFTRALLAALPANGQVLAIDTNASFIRHLRRVLPDRRLTPIHASAEEVDRLVADAGWPAADAIISGIPYSLLPKPVMLGILQAARRGLDDGGLFTGYQYSRMLRPHLLDVFGNVHYRSVLLNLPPAFVYSCRVRATGC